MHKKRPSTRQSYDQYFKNQIEKSVSGLKLYRDSKINKNAISEYQPRDQALRNIQTNNQSEKNENEQIQVSHYDQQNSYQNNNQKDNHNSSQNSIFKQETTQFGSDLGKRTASEYNRDNLNSLQFQRENHFQQQEQFRDNKNLLSTPLKSNLTSDYQSKNYFNNQDYQFKDASQMERRGEYDQLIQGKSEPKSFIDGNKFKKTQDLISKIRDMRQSSFKEQSIASSSQVNEYQRPLSANNYQQALSKSPLNDSQRPHQAFQDFRDKKSHSQYDNYSINKNSYSQYPKHIHDLDFKNQRTFDHPSNKDNKYSDNNKSYLINNLQSLRTDMNAQDFQQFSKLDQCPFSSEQLKIFREKAFKNQQGVQMDEFSQLKIRTEIYNEIIQKIKCSDSQNPTSDLGDCFFTPHELQVVRDELKKHSEPRQSYKNGFKQGKEDSSNEGCMIHMIFNFFIQSGEYQFFIRRLKNFAQSKMQQLGDLSRIQKPLKSSPSAKLQFSKTGQSNDLNGQFRLQDISNQNHSYKKTEDAISQNQNQFQNENQGKGLDFSDKKKEDKPKSFLSKILQGNKSNVQQNEPLNQFNQTPSAQNNYQTENTIHNSQQQNNYGLSENKEKNILGSCARQNEYSNQQYSYLRSKKASYDREITSLSQKEEAKFSNNPKDYDLNFQSNHIKNREDIYHNMQLSKNQKQLETVSRNSKNLKKDYSDLYLNTPEDRLAHFGSNIQQQKKQTENNKSLNYTNRNVLGTYQAKEQDYLSSNYLREKSASYQPQITFENVEGIGSGLRDENQEEIYLPSKENQYGKNILSEINKLRSNQNQTYTPDKSQRQPFASRTTDILQSGYYQNNGYQKQREGFNNHDISFAMIPSENNVRDFTNDRYGESLNKTFDYTSRYMNSQSLSQNNKENYYGSRSPNTRDVPQPKFFNNNDYKYNERQNLNENYNIQAYQGQNLSSVQNSYQNQNLSKQYDSFNQRNLNVKTYQNQIPDIGILCGQDDQDDDFRINVVKMKSEPNSSSNLQNYSRKSKNVSQDFGEQNQIDQFNKFSLLGRATTSHTRAQEAIEKAQRFQGLHENYNRINQY